MNHHAAALAWERCPYCDVLGTIDARQATGKASIVCTECGLRYFRDLSQMTGWRRA